MICKCKNSQVYGLDSKLKNCIVPNAMWLYKTTYCETCIRQISFSFEIQTNIHGFSNGAKDLDTFCPKVFSEFKQMLCAFENFENQHLLVQKLKNSPENITLVDIKEILACKLLSRVYFMTWDVAKRLSLVGIQLTRDGLFRFDELDIFFESVGHPIGNQVIKLCEFCTQPSYNDN